MNKFINSKVKKIILVLIIVVSIFTTAIPGNIVIATDEIGGALFTPIFQLLCGIADLGIKMLQDVFLGYGDVKTQTDAGGVTADDYEIRYSPAAIFSNRIPGLDINFLDPMDSVQITGPTSIDDSEKLGFDKTSYTSGGLLDPKGDELAQVREEKDEEALRGTGAYDYGYNPKTARTPTDAELNGIYKGLFIIANQAITGTNNIIWENEGNIYLLQRIETVTDAGAQKNTSIEYTLYKGVINQKTGEERESSASILQNTVATWYRVLRTVSLVGLLSVLVYIGIRIIISSTGEDKAKYKKMINNWVVAICLLFVLHYIMAGVLWITGELTKVFSVEILDSQGVDIFMTKIRNSVGGENPQDFTTTFGYTIIYIALVVLTFIFTFQYLKRLLYMAFFTMIAPLIALTYPIDKIKDGQAQAFTTWIREYVFNALIQVIHLILYFMLITSAQSLVEENPLYAVVAIGFMVPAEKFFRKLFGFDKANTVGQLGAAAGGALVMNAINKMGQKAGKEAEAKESKPPKFFGSSPSDRVLGSPAPGGRNSAPGGRNSAPGGGNPAQGGGNSAPGGGNPAQGGGNSVPGGGNQAGEATGGNSGMWGNLGRTELNRKKLLKEVVPSKFRKLNAKKGEIAKKALKKSAGVALGVTAGMVGLGVGVATGDLSNVAKYAGAGAAAGYLGGSGLAGSAIKKGENIKTSYREDFYSLEAKAILDNTDALWKNPDIRGLYKGKSKSDLQNDINQFVTLGITDPEKIAAAMKISDPGIDLSNEAKARAAALETGISDSAYGTEKNRTEYKQKIKASLISAGRSNEEAEQIAEKQMNYISQIKDNYHNS